MAIGYFLVLLLTAIAFLMLSKMWRQDTPHLAGTFKGQLEEFGFLPQEGSRSGVWVEGIIWDGSCGELEQRR